MSPASSYPVVHLELHTGNLPRACEFYTRLFGWTTSTYRVGSRTYLALGLGGRIDGGVVECETSDARWLPYVEVADVYATTERSQHLGAAVQVEPREGPAGWRSVIATPAGGEIGLWQPKTSAPTTIEWNRRSPCP
jgi:predicted enzyme related to lactoylglutathione lyase